MSLREYESYEKRRIENNAWLVAKEVAHRIASAPVLGEYIQAFVSEKPCDHFLFNGEHIKDYYGTSENGKNNVVVAGYIDKII